MDNAYSKRIKPILYSLYCNDAEAKEMIDTYANKFATYDESEQSRLYGDEEALSTDFEIYLAGLEL